MQVTEAARKHSGTASQKVQDAKDYASDTAQAGSDYVKDTQQQGESAWQKVKDRVTETVDKVIAAKLLNSHYSLLIVSLCAPHSNKLCSIFVSPVCLHRSRQLHHILSRAGLHALHSSFLHAPPTWAFWWAPG